MSKNIKYFLALAVVFILVIFVLGNYFVKLNIDGQKKLTDEKKTRINNCITKAQSWYKTELNNISAASYATLEQLCGNNSICRKNQESAVQTGAIKMATESKKFLDKKVDDCIKLDY